MLDLKLTILLPVVKLHSFKYLSATTPSGLLASFWNLPIFSQASSDPSLADKSIYKTLVRLGPPFNKMGRAFVELFKHYNWTRVVMISKRKSDNRNVFCDYSSRSIEEAFNLNSIEIADYIPIDAGITDKQIDTVLNRAKQRGRSKRFAFCDMMVTVCQSKKPLCID